MGPLPGMRARLLTMSWIVAVGLALSAPPMAAAGQATTEPETRAETLRRQREEKARELAPHEPTGLERGITLVEKRVVPLLQRDGIYAKFGSLTTGSGFAYGAGFRDRSLFRARGSLDAWAAGSLKRYWALEARVRYPLIDAGRLSVEGWARRYDYPSEEYFGPGPLSRRADRSDYKIDGVIAGGQLVLQATTPLSFAGGVEYLRPTVSPGKNGSLPGVEELFGATTAPGLLTGH